MKKIGMIGGLSWVSTAEYYRRLNEMTQNALGGVASARLVLESVDRQAYVDAVIGRGDEDAACAMILEAARAVERAGASFIVISCNDVHRFVPRVEPYLSIPFLHIAEATAAAVTQSGVDTVALLGVRKTMEGNFYPEILRRHGIATIVPDEEHRAVIHDTIYDELVHNRFTDATRRRYVEIIEDLQQRGAGGAVLGCTEIPLLVSQSDVATPLFATTEIHCRAAVDAALA